MVEGRDTIHNGYVWRTSSHTKEYDLFRESVSHSFYPQTISYDNRLIFDDDVVRHLSIPIPLDAVCSCKRLTAVTLRSTKTVYLEDNEWPNYRSMVYLEKELEKDQ